MKMLDFRILRGGKSKKRNYISMIVYITMAILDDKGKVAKRGKTNHECLNMALL